MKFLLLLSGSIVSLFSIIFLKNPKGADYNKFDYPYPVKYITLPVQKENIKMAYMDIHPEKPNGKTVVLLHGKNFSGAYWGNVAGMLFKYGYRVIVPDQMGFGKSSTPEHVQYSFQLLATNTRKLLDSLNVQKAIVIGNSMGGMLAVRFTLMFPERVEKLVLEDPIGLEDWKLKVPYQTVDDWYKKESKNDYESIKKYQKENYYHGKWNTEYDKWARMQAEKNEGEEHDKIAWNSALQYDMIFTQPVCYEFANIKVPTLLIVGKLDKTAIGKDLVSEEVKQTMGNYAELGMEVSKKIPRCRLVEMDSVGHVPHLEAYNEFISKMLFFIKA